jgi:folate-binding protein YgfZ
VLTSDVFLTDATNDLALFAILGGGAARVGHPGSSPGVLGPGVDVIVPAGKPAWRVEEALTRAGLEEATPEAVRGWMVVVGRPRLGTDADLGSLPAEAGLAAAVSTSKGCFLGQEAVARATNLGHPRRVVRHLTTLDGPLGAGERVFSGATEAGRLTSTAEHRDRWYALALVGWGAAEGPLSLADGRILIDVPTPG